MVGGSVVPTSLVLLDTVLREPGGAEAAVAAYVRNELGGVGLRARAEPMEA
ncbi:hypothetical protein [Motilibacter aurantiacus]|uniref:hypothetical protein n=1 Tax=Motilibacter aurantiacus TaxID=2714955 RepID=UPI001409D99B|nr:hypothetical protein [Motilibacter aurantiacus]NHC45065.1 hypothetical protein [Motilibacter aurantiacus]